MYVCVYDRSSMLCIHLVLPHELAIMFECCRRIPFHYQQLLVLCGIPMHRLDRRKPRHASEGGSVLQQLWWLGLLCSGLLRLRWQQGRQVLSDIFAIYWQRRHRTGATAPCLHCVIYLTVRDNRWWPKGTEPYLTETLRSLWPLEDSGTLKLAQAVQSIIRNSTARLGFHTQFIIYFFSV